MSDRDKQAARWRNYQASKDWRRQRFPGPDTAANLRALADQVEAGGEFFIERGIDNQGYEVLWLCTETPDGAYGAGFDNSFPCPPRCG